MASVNASSPSASLSPPNSSATPPLGSSTPSNSSAPPPQTPLPVIPVAPPQSPSPESSQLPTPPPPSTPVSPPPSTPTSPPPSTPTSPPPSPTVTPPPESPTTPPPIGNSPPPPVLPTPPPSIDSPPPEASPVPPSPVVVSTPPPAVPSSPLPSPGEVPLPPSPSPPSSVTTPPTERSPPPPALPPTPTTSSRPPPPSRNPPPASVRSPPPPPSIPSSLPPTVSPPSIPSSLPPLVSPPVPQGNSSVDAPPTSTPIPTIPTEKPTATPNTTAASSNTTAAGGGSLKAGPVAAIGIVVGFLALSLVIFAVWFVQKRKKKSGTSNSGFIMPSPSSQNSDSHFLKPQYSMPPPYNSVQFAGSAGGSNFAYSPESGGIGNSRSWFTYEELATATNGFSSNNLLGEGGFGCVYKGVLTDGRIVAVKQLKAGGGQGEREFRAEVEIISRVHHRHLVSLVGYCIYEYQRILVYDFVPNDTLHHHLHGESKVMDWAARIKFATGAARGIAYLHEDCNPRIIHRDIKSANILLDENFEAKVADFGLAKLMELSEQTHVSTRVMGTFGYMAPEYATSGKLTEKSDVFSFGVVLLELITGRKPVDVSQPIGDESLVEWARPLMTEALENGSFGDLVDPRLENFVEGEMLRMIETAAVCVRHSASKRPRMSQVVRALDMIDESGDITNGMKPGQSQIYDSREQSAQIRMFHRMAFGSQGFSIDSFSNSQSSWTS